MDNSKSLTWTYRFIDFLDADAAENSAVILEFGDEKSESISRVQFSQIPIPKFGHQIPEIRQKEKQLRNEENQQKQRQDPKQSNGDGDVVTKANADGNWDPYANGDFEQAEYSMEENGPNPASPIVNVRVK